MLDILTLIETLKSASGSVFSLGGGVVRWRSIKQSCFANLIKEAEYVAAYEAAKELVCLCRFLKDLEVVFVGNALRVENIFVLFILF